MATVRTYFPGIIFCILVGMVAVLLSQNISIGAVTLAIVLGIFIKAPAKYFQWFDKGVQFCERQLLAIAVTLMGVNLDYRLLSELGVKSVLIIFVSIVWTILTAIGIGKLLGLKRNTAILLGIGNGICGSAAIAATKDITGANEEEVGISIAVVNFLGTMGIFIMPIVGTT
ncbi:MAG: putative sulfate exporter family transporter, partial [Pirellulaceae bacterium]|nr:putative sulfate exporter family transporter [Pirellulaceae bacterium]